MEKEKTYKGFDLTKATVNDIATDQMPPDLIDFEPGVSEEDQRIDALFGYAEKYDLHDLTLLLKGLYKSF
ncbi:MAG: hypothetical protein WCY77_10210 [Weeksellaceae bacterium]